MKSCTYIVRSIVCCFCLAGALGTIALATTSQDALPEKSIRKDLPNFALTDSTGNRVSLSKYKGRVILLDFWATWCDVCKTTIPEYSEIQTQFGRNGLSVIGAALDDDGWKSVTPFAMRMKIPYTILLGNWNEIQHDFELKGLPVSLLIDRSGKIADTHLGREDKQILENKIKNLLTEQP